jgi:hypothetical protein
MAELNRERVPFFICDALAYDNHLSFWHSYSSPGSKNIAALAFRGDSIQPGVIHLGSNNCKHFI